MTLSGNYDTSPPISSHTSLFHCITVVLVLVAAICTFLQSDFRF